MFGVRGFNVRQIKIDYDFQLKIFDHCIFASGRQRNVVKP
jgi:hypothetical protein